MTIRKHLEQVQTLDGIAVDGFVIPGKESRPDMPCMYLPVAANYGRSSIRKAITEKQAIHSYRTMLKCKECYN